MTSQVGFVRDFQIDPNNERLPIYWEVDLRGLIKYLEEKGDVRVLSADEFYRMFPDFNGDVSSWGSIMNYLRSNDLIDVHEYYEENMFTIPHNESIVIVKSTEEPIMIYSPTILDADFTIYTVIDPDYIEQLLTSIVMTCHDKGKAYILDVLGYNDYAGAIYYLVDMDGNEYGHNIEEIINEIGDCSHMEVGLPL